MIHPLCRRIGRLVLPCLLCLTANAVAAQELAADVLKADHAERFGTPAGGASRALGLSGQGCKLCHDREQWNPRKESEDVDGWYLLNEISTWMVHDHHYQAYSVLLNEQSQQMARRLGIEKDGKSLVHQHVQCLACHTSAPVSQMSAGEDGIVDVDTLKSSLFNNGVSCEACHGPMGNRPDGKPGWGAEHVPLAGKDRLAWRSKSPQEKFEEFGYWDVNDTRTQTRICLSCHLGNVEQGKVITHEMYAAGHPPLPSFELSQFVHQMPRHWRRLDEKEQKLRDEFYALQKATPADASNSPVTQASLIAALVTLEESMRLTAGLIGENKSTEWPELANYACFNCHHELKNQGWRSMRQLTKTPGRPTLHEWPFALPRAMSRHFQDLKLDREIEDVSAALNARAYGDSTKLQAAAIKLAAALQSRSEAWSRSGNQYDEKLPDWLTAVAEFGMTEPVDYDSARQLIWAIERGLTERVRPKERTEFWEGEPIPTAWNSEFPANDQLKDVLILWLRGNRADGETVETEVDGKKFKREQFAIDVAEVLRKISAYDPKLTREAFGKLSKSPPSKP